MTQKPIFPKIPTPLINWDEIYSAQRLAKELSESIRVQHLQMVQELANPMKAVAESIRQSNIASTAKLVSTLTESIKVPELNYMQDIAKQMTSTLSVFQEQYVKGFQDLAKKLIEEEESNKEIIMESGWFLSTVFLDLDFIPVRKAFDDYKNGDKEAFYKLVRSTFRYKRFQNLNSSLERWKNNRYFKGRDEILEQAIKSHKRGEYYNSVISLLTQIEGIAGEYCAQNQHTKVRQGSSDGLGKLKEALADKNIEFSYFYKESILNQVESFIFKSSGKSFEKFDTALNRNVILHGNSKNFGTEMNSYKCILLLDILSALE